MPDITPNDIAALSDLLTTLCPNLSLAISEQINRDVLLESPEVTTVPIQDILAQTDSVLATVFSMSAPLAAESVLLSTEATGRIFTDLIEGNDGSAPPLVLSDEQTEKLAAAMANVARGLANALSNLTEEPVEIESCATHAGPMTLPPVFALNGNAIQATLSLIIPEMADTQLILLVTPEQAQALVAATTERSTSAGLGADDELMGEAELAAMLNDIGGFTP